MVQNRFSFVVTTTSRRRTIRTRQHRRPDRYYMGVFANLESANDHLVLGFSSFKISATLLDGAFQTFPPWHRSSRHALADNRCFHRQSLSLPDCPPYPLCRLPPSALWPRRSVARRVSTSCRRGSAVGARLLGASRWARDLFSRVDFIFRVGALKQPLKTLVLSHASIPHNIFHLRLCLQHCIGLELSSYQRARLLLLAYRRLSAKKCRK